MGTPTNTPICMSVESQGMIVGGDNEFILSEDFYDARLPYYTSEDGLVFVEEDYTDLVFEFFSDAVLSSSITDSSNIEFNRVLAIPDTYSIDFEVEKVDLQSRAKGRTLIQFHDSVVLQAVLSGIVAEVQALSDAIVSTMKNRTLYHATGANLDVIGRIVGLNRTGSSYNVSDMPFDTEDDINLLVEDGQMLIVTGASPNSVLQDGLFRSFLLLKIMKNFTKYSSVDEIKRQLNMTVSVPVAINRTGMMSIDLVAPGNASQSILYMLGESTDNYEVDQRFLMAYPTTINTRVVKDTYLLTENSIDFLTEDSELVNVVTLANI